MKKISQHRRTNKGLVALSQWVTISLLLTCVEVSHAGKLDLMTGFYSLEAKVKNKKGNSSAFGAYKVSYSTPMFSDHFELEIGYTLLMSKTVGGDLAYGVEASAVYFPFSPSTHFIGQTDNATLQVKPIWRPFISLSFNQRQAQSVSAGYAGFGATLGTERSLDKYFDLKSFVRYIALSGPNAATANEITFFLGITMPFSLSN